MFIPVVLRQAAGDGVSRHAVARGSPLNDLNPKLDSPPRWQPVARVGHKSAS